jgi:hypothetical protein
MTKAPDTRSSERHVRDLPGPPRRSVVNEPLRHRAPPRGRDAEAAVPGMRAHLEGCPACAEERDSLFALVAADDAGEAA